MTKWMFTEGLNKQQRPHIDVTEIDFFVEMHLK